VTRLRWLRAGAGAAVVAALALVAGLAAERQRPIEVRWVAASPASNELAVVVSGLDVATLHRLISAEWTTARWQRLLSVFAGQGDLLTDLSVPPMLGSHRVVADTLRFEPQFPLFAGVSYRAVFRPAELPGPAAPHTNWVIARFTVPTPAPGPATVVSRVYPGADVVPENLLKFYLHFSAPMSRGHSYEHLQLRDDAGKVIELPFLELDEELWDPSMQRLTLFIDPGRIKRGVQPLEEIGPSLEAGHSYTLVIDRAWTDAGGHPLGQTFRKTFRVGPPDRDPPDPAHWKLEPGRAGTREPLTITFPESMEHALACRMIRPTLADGSAIEGDAVTEDEERRWKFTPGQPWRAGRHQLVIQTLIEDLAGNNIGKPFEVDLFERVEIRPSNPTVALAFEIH